MYTLKHKCRHFDEIFITGCTESCQNDNFRCSQWLKFHQNDNISVSVYFKGYTVYFCCNLNFHPYFTRIGLCSGMFSLRWRYNGRDSVSNHQPHHCLLNRLFRCRSKKTSKLRVTGLCVGNPPGTGEFPAQMASNAENVSIWWRHHVLETTVLY